MNFEKVSLPEDNELPLDIRRSEEHAHGSESTVWKTTVQTPEQQEKLIALKQGRRHEFADDAEMKKSKEFYDFLKSFPDFGKFVPDTLYFKARATANDQPQEYAIQRFLEGKSIDQIDDADLYNDPELVRELFDFANAAKSILEKTRENKTHKPDLGTAGTASTEAIIKGCYFANPRYSTNVVISDRPNEQGQRVFFVDTGVNFDERTSTTTETLRREIGSRLQEFQLRRWSKKLAEIMESQKPEKKRAATA